MRIKVPTGDSFRNVKGVIGGKLSHAWRKETYNPQITLKKAQFINEFELFLSFFATHLTA